MASSLWRFPFRQRESSNRKKKSSYRKRDLTLFIRYDGSFLTLPSFQLSFCIRPGLPLPFAGALLSTNHFTGCFIFQTCTACGFLFFNRWKWWCQRARKRRCSPACNWRVHRPFCGGLHAPAEPRRAGCIFNVQDVEAMAQHGMAYIVVFVI